MSKFMIVFILALMAGGSTLQAAATASAAPAQPGAQLPAPPPFDIPSVMPTLFALSAGSKCPGGSALYQGPESRLAAKDKMIYCSIARKDVVVLHRSATLVACPPPMKPYKPVDAGLTPESDVLWCRFPLPSEPILPPAVPEPPAATGK